MFRERQECAIAVLKTYELTNRDYLQHILRSYSTHPKAVERIFAAWEPTKGLVNGLAVSLAFADMQEGAKKILMGYEPTDVVVRGVIGALETQAAPYAKEILRSYEQNETMAVQLCSTLKSRKMCETAYELLTEFEPTSTIAIKLGRRLKSSIARPYATKLFVQYGASQITVSALVPHFRTRTTHGALREIFASYGEESLHYLPAQRRAIVAAHVTF